MAQNIYDDPGFFAGYSRLSRSVEGLDGAAEWPAMRALLPDLHGKRVVDLGCGFGWFCRWAREHGATKVLGIDVSENMLARARTDTPDAAITYLRADLDQLALPENGFDLAYSSLALHYVVRLDALLRTVRRALVPGGKFVISVEHPIYLPPTHPGWMQQTGRTVWPLDAYLREGTRTLDWLAKGVVKQHRTIATYLKLLMSAGFTLTQVEEWGPSDAQIAEHPDWAIERDRPMFLLLAAQR